ncbi:helix-turn-helix domain-containing protein [Agrobacterium tumefaciens]|uniref:helix-turn-helix domain-containing protein n=1 Tax=Agrobacterium tumefaciens TaxID=358 RepID=UPI0030137B98
MSILIMSRLFRAQLGSSSRKMLAVRLADFADDNGKGIWPSVETLAQETELSVRTVQRLLADFVNEGLLIIVRKATGRPGEATRYDFDMRAIDRLPDAKQPETTGDTMSPVTPADQTGDTMTRVTPTTETGDTDCGEGCHHVTRTVIEPSIEPSVERDAPARGNLGDEEENPKAIETAFKRFFVSWKTAIHDSEPDARREWGALSPDERASALAHSESYQAVALSTGRKYLCSAAKYLKERRWVKLTEQSVQSPQTETTEMFSVFSRAGRALLMTKLFLPVRALSLTPIEQNIVENKPEKKDLIWRDKKERQGWPEAVQLIERKRFAVTNHIVEISKDFERVAVNGPVWEAWKRAHAERCWPWPLAPERLEFAQFPPIPADVNDLDEAVSIAIENFKSRLNEGRNDDAA